TAATMQMFSAPLPREQRSRGASVGRGRGGGSFFNLLDPHAPPPLTPPHPNSGLPEFGTLSGRSRTMPTSAEEGNAPSLLLIVGGRVSPAWRSACSRC